MNNDALYDLAYEYRKTKLWQKLWDTQLFAVKMSDGKIGYISIMGNIGEFCALAVYIGSDGFESLRNIAMNDPKDMPRDKVIEISIQQSCLQCAFIPASELKEDELNPLKEYLQSKGKRLTRTTICPQLLKYQPYLVPWFLQTDKDRQYLSEALSAAIEMSKLLKGKQPKSFGILEFNDTTPNLPMLEKDGDNYKLTRTPVPKPTTVKFPEPKVCNDITVAKLKKQKRFGILECEITLIPEPFQEKPNEIPHFHLILFAIEKSTSFLLQMPPTAYYEDSPGEYLNTFIKSLIDAKFYPVEIRVRDERTYSFMKSLCQRAKIGLSIQDNLTVLDEIKEKFFAEFFGKQNEPDDELIELVELVLQLSKASVKSLPDDLKENLKKLISKDILPPDMKKALIKKLDYGKGDVKPVPIHTDELSYVISVSLCTGCYRHIKISAGDTLFNLHKAILDAFEFSDDHAHAFFMDNISWSQADAYYAEGINYESDDNTLSTYDVVLKHLNLAAGKKFKYIFDFGEEWTFQCKVLKAVNESTSEPTVVRCVGKPPLQYS